jgi:polysaccharide deacetylase 2 family uncharacterized protein YibQ
MGNRRDQDPSPLRSGIFHTSISLAVFGGLTAALAAGIHVSGNAADASPHQTFALFDSADESRPVLKARFKSDSLDANKRGEISLMSLAAADTAPEADLGVEYQDGEANFAQVETPISQGDADVQNTGIRINGKLVRPGESLSQVTAIESLEKSPIAGLYETVQGKRLPRISDAGIAPSDAYARPFANPDSKPVVALVIGGLGINHTHTVSAIDELPPEVTLSFAPDARNLQRYINQARAAGHEVMIEVPMEAHAYGRMKMHPQTLRAAGDAQQNVNNLQTILGKANGYFGVINYQGAKFADDKDALSPVLESISARGIAFIEDGSLSRTAFDSVATATSLRYAKASEQIDAKLTATDINAQLHKLETTALASGTAMGAGYAYPITIEMAKTWTDNLAEKGLILAPVSAMTSVDPVPTRAAAIETGLTKKASIDTAG